MTTYHSKYAHGDIVYHRASDEPHRGVITKVGFVGSADTPALYSIDWGQGKTSPHFEYELTDEFIPDYSRECQS